MSTFFRERCGPKSLIEIDQNKRTSRRKEKAFLGGALHAYRKWVAA